MNELKTFENERFGNVRVTMIDNEPWFVAADVCKALEIEPTATRRLDDDEKNTLRLTQGTSGNPNVTIVNESGLYSLVLGSRKPEAKVFKRWLTHDVIPTIRPTARHSIQGVTRINETAIMNIQGIDCYEKDGTAYIKLEHVAWGLGFTQTQNKAGKQYASVRWERVEQYLTELGFPHKWGKDDYIPENIFYRLAMKSKNEVAERFQAKVADEIIPAIRRTGGYVNNEELFLDTYFPTLDAGAKAMFKQTLVSLREANKKIEQDKPKVFFADSVEISENSVLVKTLAALLTQNGYKIGQNKLFELLRNDGYLVSRRGQSRNMPTQKAIDRGLFEVKESVICIGGEHRVTQTTYVTGKGQIYFVNKYCNKQLSVSND